MTRFLNGEGADPSQFGLSGGAVAGGLVFAAGMALDFETMTRDAAAVTIADETRMVLKDLEETLGRAGAGLGDIVKMNCYLSDDDFRTEFWQTYDEVFAELPAHVRITQVVGIALGCRVELDAIAVAPTA